MDENMKNDAIDEAEINPLSDNDDDAEDVYDAVDKIRVVEEGNNLKSEDANMDQYDAKIPIQFWVLCIYSVLTSMAFTTLTAMFPLYVNEVFGLSSLDVGFIILVIAVVIA